MMNINAKSFYPKNYVNKNAMKLANSGEYTLDELAEKLDTTTECDDTLDSTDVEYLGYLQKLSDGQLTIEEAGELMEIPVSDGCSDEMETLDNVKN